LPDACAGAEVDNVSKSVLEDFEQIDKSPPKCVQTRDPQTRGQILKRPHAFPTHHAFPRIPHSFPPRIPTHSHAFPRRFPTFHTASPRSWRGRAGKRERLRAAAGCGRQRQHAGKTVRHASSRSNFFSSTSVSNCVRKNNEAVQEMTASAKGSREATAAKGF
jgi:hypothetical protein